ncbi:RidA family protein [Streptomyces violaceusniger]|uniref:RidA family protein n=1 Tax=Streptomyces violaceusniger TaxID=68280 RepID=UPI003F57C91A
MPKGGQQHRRPDLQATTTQENPGHAAEEPLLRRCLAAADATFDDVVKLTCFVTDTAHMPAIREARTALIPDDRLPAASAVQVVSLVRPQCLMEVEAFGVVAQ